MKFATLERKTLLAVKGVGPTVIERLEQMGFNTFSALAEADAKDILKQGASLTGASCWNNSPQAKAAIESAITAAVHAVHDLHDVRKAD